MAEKQSVLGRITDSPTTSRLMESLTDNLSARVSAIGQPKPDGIGVKENMKEGAKSGAVKGAVKGATDAIKPSGKKSKRPSANITDPLFIATDIDTVWDVFTDYEEWPTYMKGPQTVSVEEKDGKKVVKITGKIFLSSRDMTTTIVEEDEPFRVRWECEGPKGKLHGVVVFSELAENLTMMNWALDYRSSGPIEWIGNRWRTVGRRVRLDYKLFALKVMNMDQSEQSDDEPDEGEADD